MNPMTIDTIYGKYVLLGILAYMGCSFIFKKFKLDVRHICFLVGTMILAFMHNKGTVYFGFVSIYVLAYGFRKVNFDFSLINRKVFIFLKPIFITGVSCVLLAFVYIVPFIYEIVECKSNIEGAVNYILDNYDKDKIILYTGFDDGGYVEFRGLKTYIDPRAELFVKKYNGKEDILLESFMIDDSNYKEILDKYQFTHLLVDYDSNLRILLEKDEDYTLVYNQYYNDSVSGEGIIAKVFVNNKLVDVE